MSGPTPTRISALCDHLLKQIALALPCHQELMDSDDLFENPPEVLKKGYGLNISDGENADLCIDNTAYYHRRRFIVIITRDELALQGDSTTRKDKWKAIMEDLHAVLKRLASETSIVDATVVPAKVLSFKSMYASDSGPRNTVIKGASYNFIELTVVCEYREPLNGGN